MVQPQLSGSSVPTPMPPALKILQVAGYNPITLRVEGDQALRDILCILEEVQGVIDQNVQDHLHQSYDAYDALPLSRTHKRTDIQMQAFHLQQTDLSCGQ